MVTETRIEKFKAGTVLPVINAEISEVIPAAIIPLITYAALDGKIQGVALLVGCAVIWFFSIKLVQRFKELFPPKAIYHFFDWLRAGDYLHVTRDFEPIPLFVKRRDDPQRERKQQD